MEKDLQLNQLITKIIIKGEFSFYDTQRGIIFLSKGILIAKKKQYIFMIIKDILEN